MIKDNLFNKIEKILPDKHDDLIESLTMFRITINETIDELQEEIYKKMSERNFKGIENLLDIAKECYELDKNINELNLKKENPQKNNNQNINHHEYLVNNKIEHSIHENFKYKKPYAFRFINKNILKVNSWQDMLVKTCKILYEEDKEKFLNLENMIYMNEEGTKYFTKNPDNLKLPGLVGNEVYVELNQSSNFIVKLIKKLLKEFNYDYNKFTIFLKSNYTELYVKKD